MEAKFDLIPSLVRTIPQEARWGRIILTHDAIHLDLTILNVINMVDHVHNILYFSDKRKQALFETGLTEIG